MAKYPIKVFPKLYRGNDPKKKKKYQEMLRIAREIEDYINGKMRNCEQEIFTYDEIAENLYIDVKTIAALLIPSGGGNTGITVFNPEHGKK